MTRAQYLRKRKHDNEVAAKKRAAFVAQGLRCDGLPRAQRKPCGCLAGSCLKCRKKDNKGYFSDEEVAAMWKDYSDGMSRTAVEKKHGVANKGLQEVFKRRGFKLRPATHMPPRDPVTGKIIPHVPKTKEQLAAMIAKLKRLAVPTELKHEWRLWSLKKRAAFVRRLRKKFPSNRPVTPFIGCESFEYGNPHAHAIAKRINAGRISRKKLIMLKPASEGVIWNERLFFWDKNSDYVASISESKSRSSRGILKRIIYEKHFGPIPDQTLIIQKDGNKNNFLPENLELLSMADNARRNHWQHNPALVRGGISKRIAVKCWLTRGKRMTASSRAQIGALLDDNSTGLFEQITRSTK